MRFKNQVIKGSILILAAAIIALIVRLILFPEMTASTQVRLTFTSVIILGIYLTGFFVINEIFNRKIKFEKGIKRRIILQLVSGIVYVFCLRSLMFYLGRNYIPVEITRTFSVTVYLLDLATGLALNISFFAEHFFSEWKKSIERAERLEKEKALVQYDNLKNQLNPHFLFNSLTSLNSLISEDQELASQYLKHLSRVYRYLLENREFVSLKQELEFLENYKFLIKMRHGDALLIYTDIPADKYDFQIIPVTLQNLIENALKHNIINGENPLTIRIYSDDSYLCVSNNLQRKKTVENSNRQGLENLKNLYQYLSTEKVSVTETPDSFTVRIPLLTTL
jgi:two-component system, LytTR family, sensor kinase